MIIEHEEAAEAIAMRARLLSRPQLDKLQVSPVKQ
jgi:hypothetical protein